MAPLPAAARSTSVLHQAQGRPLDEVIMRRVLAAARCMVPWRQRLMGLLQERARLAATRCMALLQMLLWLQHLLRGCHPSRAALPAAALP